MFHFTIFEPLGACLQFRKYTLSSCDNSLLETQRQMPVCPETKTMTLKLPSSLSRLFIIISIYLHSAFDISLVEHLSLSLVHQAANIFFCLPLDFHSYALPAILLTVHNIGFILSHCVVKYTSCNFCVVSHF